MLSITDRATKYIKKLLDKAGIACPPGGIRFVVKAGGCKGLEITHELVKDHNRSDTLRMFRGAMIIIDPKSMIHMENVEVDHTDNLLDPPFIYNNPTNCGCGKSFEPNSPI